MVGRYVLIQLFLVTVWILFWRNERQFSTLFLVPFENKRKSQMNRIIEKNKIRICFFLLRLDDVYLSTWMIKKYQILSCYRSHFIWDPFNEVVFPHVMFVSQTEKKSGLFLFYFSTCELCTKGDGAEIFSISILNWKKYLFSPIRKYSNGHVQWITFFSLRR